MELINKVITIWIICLVLLIGYGYQRYKTTATPQRIVTSYQCPYCEKKVVVETPRTPGMNIGKKQTCPYCNQISITREERWRR